MGTHTNAGAATSSILCPWKMHRHIPGSSIHTRSYTVAAIMSAGAEKHHCGPQQVPSRARDSHDALFLLGWYAGSSSMTCRAGCICVPCQKVCMRASTGGSQCQLCCDGPMHLHRSLQVRVGCKRMHMCSMHTRSGMQKGSGTTHGPAPCATGRGALLGDNAQRSTQHD